MHLARFHLSLDTTQRCWHLAVFGTTHLDLLWLRFSRSRDGGFDRGCRSRGFFGFYDAFRWFRLGDLLRWLRHFGFDLVIRNCIQSGYSLKFFHRGRLWRWSACLLSDVLAFENRQNLGLRNRHRDIRAPTAAKRGSKQHAPRSGPTYLGEGGATLAGS